jgi:hypothetical protein
MSVIPAADAELVVPVVVLELDEVLELELQAARSVAVATAATTAVVARREIQLPAPGRLRSVMEPPRAASGLRNRRCGPRGETPLNTQSAIGEENRSDVCWCQCPETRENRLIPNRYL